MDVKPTTVKKKKKVSKKRAEEITRRRNTIIQTASDLDISHINHLEVVAEDALLNLNNEEAEKLKRIGSIQEESEVSPSQEETELVPSVSEPENLNELGLEDKENPEFHYVETKEDSDTELYELQESDLWKHTKPIKVVKDISKKLKARRAERRRSSELSDSDTKAAIDLLRIQRTVNAIKGRKSSGGDAKFFWDNVRDSDEGTPEPQETQKAPSLFRSRVKDVMSKDAAMNVLGLAMTTEGKKQKALTITDYSEDQLLVAFRETCSTIDDHPKESQVSRMEAHEAYQTLLKLLRAKNRFLGKMKKNQV